MDYCHLRGENLHAEILAMGHITWVYVPGHAGASVNVEADRLAAKETNHTPLELLHTDVKLWSQQRAKHQFTDDNCGTYEGSIIPSPKQYNMVSPAAARLGDHVDGDSIKSPLGTSAVPLSITY